MTERVKIHGLSHDGQGIGHQGGKTWFVRGALPDEEVSVKDAEGRKKQMFAQVDKIWVASESRRPPLCDYAHQCGGCELWHQQPDSQLQHKQSHFEYGLKKILKGDFEGVMAPPLSGVESGYRHRTRLQVKGESLGFFVRQGKQLVDVRQCLVLTQGLNELLKPLRAVLRQIPKSGVFELLVDEDPSGQMAVVLHSKKPLPPNHQGILESFAQQQGIWLWWQWGQQRQALAEGALSYVLNGLRLSYYPWNFTQANWALNEKMVSLALNWLDPQPHEHALDLFSGLGNFTLPLAQRVQSVIAVEGLASLTDQCLSNARANGLANVTAHTADLFKATRLLHTDLSKAQVAIIDPPRAGASHLCEQMIHLPLTRLVYVSCNPATLMRDVALLVKQGWAVKKATVLDMFPNTAHIESMMLLEKG